MARYSRFEEMTGQIPSAGEQIRGSNNIKFPAGRSRRGLFWTSKVVDTTSAGRIIPWRDEPLPKPAVSSSPKVNIFDVSDNPITMHARQRRQKAHWANVATRARVDTALASNVNFGRPHHYGQYSFPHPQQFSGFSRFRRSEQIGTTWRTFVGAEQGLVRDAFAPLSESGRARRLAPLFGQEYPMLPAKPGGARINPFSRVPMFPEGELDSFDTPYHHKLFAKGPRELPVAAWDKVNIEERVAGVGKDLTAGPVEIPDWFRFKPEESPLDRYVAYTKVVEERTGRNFEGIIKEPWQADLNKTMDQTELSRIKAIRESSERYITRRAKFYGQIDPRLIRKDYLERFGLTRQGDQMFQVAGEGTNLPLTAREGSRALAAIEPKLWDKPIAGAGLTRVLTTNEARAIRPGEQYFGTTGLAGKRVIMTEEGGRTLATEAFGQTRRLIDPMTGKGVPLGSVGIHAVGGGSALDSAYSRLLVDFNVSEPSKIIRKLRNIYQQEFRSAVNSGGTLSARGIEARAALLNIAGIEGRTLTTTLAGTHKILGQRWRMPGRATKASEVMRFGIEKRAAQWHEQFVTNLTMAHGATRDFAWTVSQQADVIEGMDRSFKGDYVGGVITDKNKLLHVGRVTNIGQTTGRAGVLMQDINETWRKGGAFWEEGMFPQPYSKGGVPDVFKVHLRRIQLAHGMQEVRAITEGGFDLGRIQDKYMLEQIKQQAFAPKISQGSVGEMYASIYPTLKEEIVRVPGKKAYTRTVGQGFRVGLHLAGEEKAKSIRHLVNQKGVWRRLQAVTGQAVVGRTPGVSTQQTLADAFFGRDFRIFGGPRDPKGVKMMLERLTGKTIMAGAVGEKAVVDAAAGMGGIDKWGKKAAIGAAILTAGALVAYGASRVRGRKVMDERDIPSSMYGAPSMGPQYTGGQPAYQQRANITPTDYRGGYTTNINMETEDRNGIMDYRGIANTMSSASRTALGVNKISTDLHVTDDSRSINSNQIQRQFAEYLNR